MLNTFYHLEGYILAQKDNLEYLDNYLDIKFAEYTAKNLTDDEFCTVNRTVNELRSYFRDVKGNYEKLLRTQRDSTKNCKSGKSE